MSLKAQNGKKTGDKLGDGQKACKNHDNREENVDLSATSKSTVSMERTICEQASKRRWISETERSQAKKDRGDGELIRRWPCAGDGVVLLREATSVNMFTVVWRH